MESTLTPREVNGLYATAFISLTGKAVAEHLWSGARAPTPFEMAILAARMTKDFIPAPSQPEPQRLWLIGCARRLGLLPWPHAATLPAPQRRVVDFYSTRAWKELRYEAFKRYGRRCCVCGATNATAELHVDHIFPRSKYPQYALDITRVQILCRDCNIAKGNRDEIDWRPNASGRPGSS